MDCRPRTKGFPRRFCQELPGCDASSVLSLDNAFRSRDGAILQPKAFRFVKHEHVPEKLKTKYPKNSKQNTRKTQNIIPEKLKFQLLRFQSVIKQHNETAAGNKEHPSVLFREPSLLIIICSNCPMAYTTENGVKIIPVGCLKD